ncbi:uncharacterized protein EI97DRAFT_295503 [Westerdykella ornata]|uniref:RBR-type E3 ubiquitin transferase n=1 Tax=Westerdykella ornata TaxID=318751 RepID=A0A6A6JMP3_WESOR|nr:uncharacterized protein EI97DRAFT_295503 [Westerdykella ornata]KAF2277504.1 hypothetical protein EI97DRAFT_295503 [Westerdykella ornata]
MEWSSSNIGERRSRCASISSSSSTHEDVDDQYPLLHLKTRGALRQNSAKAQQILGLVTVTGFRGVVREKSDYHKSLTGLRPNGEERPLLRHLRYLDDSSSFTSTVSSHRSVDYRLEEDLGTWEGQDGATLGREVLVGTRSQSGRRDSQRNSWKAQQMLGLIDQYPRARKRASLQSTVQGQRPRSEANSEMHPDLEELLRLYQDDASQKEVATESGQNQSEGNSPVTVYNEWESSGGLSTPQRYTANGYINFSRPLSQQSPNSLRSEAAGERLFPRTPHITRDDLGLPRTPSFANTLVLAKPIFERVVPSEDRAEDSGHYSRLRHLSSLWTSLPMCMVRLGKKGSKPTATDMVGKEEGEERIPLTEYNLREYEGRVGPRSGHFNQDAQASPLPSLVEADDSPSSKAPTGIDEKLLPSPPSSSTSWYSAMSPPRPSTVAPSRIPTRPPSTTPTLRSVEVIDRQVDLAVCQVCREAKVSSAYPIRQCTAKCTHPPHTCIDCVRDWIASCIRYKGWDQCVCPECRESLDYQDVKFFVSEDLFLRYDNMAARAALSKIPAFYWCLSTDCSSGQIHPWPLSSHAPFVCIACKYTYCLNHPSVPYHAGLSCEEYDALVDAPTSASSTGEHSGLQARTVQERLDEQMAREIGRRCPNALCGWWVEKSEGCDHITCYKCQFEWCWECGAPFAVINRRGNKFHRKGCRYYG